VHARFWWGNRRERDHLEDLRADGNAIIKCILREWGRGMDWIGLSHDRNGLRGVVNAVMNIRVR